MIYLLLLTYWDFDWQPKLVTTDLFETTKTIGQTLVNNLTKLLDQYGLRNKSIAYVNDEGSNLNTMTIALKFVTNFQWRT